MDSQTTTVFQKYKSCCTTVARFSFKGQVEKTRLECCCQSFFPKLFNSLPLDVFPAPVPAPLCRDMRKMFRPFNLLDTVSSFMGNGGPSSGPAKLVRRQLNRYQSCLRFWGVIYLVLSCLCCTRTVTGFLILRIGLFRVLKLLELKKSLISIFELELLKIGYF